VVDDLHQIAHRARQVVELGKDVTLTDEIQRTLKLGTLSHA
jgi:hypothetical protein